MATAVPDDLIDVPDDLVDVPAPRAAAPQPGVPRAIGVAAPPPPRPPQRTLAERIRGVMEAGVELASQITGGAVGVTGGAIGGLAGAMASGDFGTQQGARRVAETAAASGERGTGAVRGVLRGMLWGDAPVSEAGQENIDAVTGVMQNVPAAIAAPRGTIGMSPQQPLGIKPALQAVGGTTRAAGSRVVDAALPAMTPEVAGTVVKAGKEGIPVAPHQLVENRVLQFLGESAENVPFSGGGKTRKARAEGFSRGLAALIDPEAAQGVRVLDQRTFRDLQDMAGKRIGAVYDRLGGVPREAIGDLVEAAAQHSEAGIRDTIATFARRLDATADQHGGAVPGPLLRQLRTEAARLERETKASRPDLSAAYERVTKKLDDAIEPFAADGDVPLLAEARRQYAVSKTLEPLVARHPNGKIPPGDLHSALTSTEKGRTRMARGTAGEQGEYARLGKEILEENVLSDSPTHHTSFRGAGAMATGGLAGAYYLGGPVGVLTAWGGSALYNLIGPRAVKWAAKRTMQRTAPVDVPVPPKPSLELAPEGPLPPRPAGEAPAAPMGDLTPDWETAPGAAPAAPRAEVVSPEGLVPAIDSVEGPARVRVAGEPQPPAKGAGMEIPAVPGRPDLPETMVAGPPAELAPTQAVGAAMQEPTTALARRQQEAARLAAETQSPEVQRVLSEHARKLERQAAAEVAKQKRLQDAAELRRVAAQAADPEIQQALHARAATLEAAEPVPAGKAKEGAPAAKAAPAKADKPVPAGEVTEIAAEVVEPVAAAPAAAPVEPAPRRTEPRVGKAGPKDKFVVGRVYRDSKGNMAIRQADGSWKEIK